MKPTKSQRNSKALFELGQVVSTPGFLDAVVNTDEDFVTFLSRHIVGDWGEVDDDDRRANDDALRYGARLLSVYYLADGTKFWIITEADRSMTTLLLPSEY